MDAPWAAHYLLGGTLPAAHRRRPESGAGGSAARDVRTSELVTRPTAKAFGALPGRSADQRVCGTSEVRDVGIRREGKAMLGAPAAADKGAVGSHTGASSL